MREIIVHGGGRYTRSNPEKTFVITWNGVSCHDNKREHFVGIDAYELEAIWRAYQKEKDGERRKRSSRAKK